MAQQLITPVPTPAAHKANNSTAVTAVFIIALVFFFAPWAAAAIFGFSRPGEGFTFGPLVEAFENPRAWRALQDTLLLAVATRSEEHTSELQSRGHLVCRLLLAKKKQNTTELSQYREE